MLRKILMLRIYKKFTKQKYYIRMIRKFRANKMIRDNMAEIFAKSGIKTITHIMEENEYLKMIKEKILEEAYEATDASDIVKIKGEIADTIEALYALCSFYEISLDEIEAIRVQKIANKGRFEKKIFCEVIEMDENNPMIDHYLENSEKYPEII